MKSLAIIAARGGSKRIPKKNIRSFCGKPILLYSVEAALESGCFDEVMVSTDSEEIAEIAVERGASVPFMRSTETSGDFATTSDVLAEVLLNYQERDSVYDMVCCIYPTAPFVTPEKLREGKKLLEGNDRIDTVMTVVQFSYPPQRGLLLKDGILSMREPEHTRTRSQDLPPIFHDAGQFYWFRPERFLKTSDLMQGQISPVIVSELEVQDIDTETDWKIAEQKYRLMKGKED